MRRGGALVLFALVSLGLVACGNKGALYLPEQAPAVAGLAAGSPAAPVQAVKPRSKQP